MKTFRFLDFPVYKTAKDFYNLSVQITKLFPRVYWELSDQWRRAALSIVLNVAEGSAKYSDKDFKRYIENALGSVSGYAACVDVANDHRLISEKTRSEAMVLLESMAKQLGGLSKKLRSSFR